MGRDLSNLTACILAIAFIFVVAGVKADTAAEQGAVRIALLSDLHLSQHEAHQEYRVNLEQVIDQVNTAKVDLVLFAGDLTTHGLAESAEDFLRYKAQLDSPAWAVPGNLDVGHKPMGAGTASVTDERVDTFEALIGPSFFLETLGEHVRVIGINTSLLGSGLEREQEQWEFLESHLAEADPDGRRTILLTHYPLFVDQPEERENYFNLSLAARERLAELIRAGGVDLVLSGHAHRPLEHRHAGALHLTAPPVSFGHPPDQYSPGWTLITIDPAGPIDFEHRYLDPTLHGEEARRTGLGEKLEELAPIGILPMADEDNYVHTFLRRHGALDDIQELTAEQVVDESFLTPERFQTLWYLSGERFQRTAVETGDIEETLHGYMRQGGILVVLSSGPMPFYVDEADHRPGTAQRLGLRLLATGETVNGVGGFEQPSRGQSLWFITLGETVREAGVPWLIRYPERGDLRWRPAIEPSSFSRYDRLIMLADEGGRARGDGAVYMENRDEEDGWHSRILYASAVLTQAHPQRNRILEGIMQHLWTVATADAADEQ